MCGLPRTKHLGIISLYHPLSAKLTAHPWKTENCRTNPTSGWASREALRGTFMDFQKKRKESIQQHPQSSKMIQQSYVRHYRTTLFSNHPKSSKTNHPDLLLVIFHQRLYIFCFERPEVHLQFSPPCAKGRLSKPKLVVSKVNDKQQSRKAVKKL